LTLDRSGHGNNGNAISLNTKSVTFGQIGQGLKFDGVDDYVNINNIASLVNKTQGSFAAWVFANH